MKREPSRTFFAGIGSRTCWFFGDRFFFEGLFEGLGRIVDLSPQNTRTRVVWCSAQKVKISYCTFGLGEIWCVFTSCVFLVCAVSCVYYIYDKKRGL